MEVFRTSVFLNSNFDILLLNNLFICLFLFLTSATDVHLKEHALRLARVKTFGITINSDLKFDKHISDLQDKVSKKINAFCQVTDYMFLEKRRIVIKTFVKSSFNYFPLIWILLHCRTQNNKINRLHERALRIAYSDSKSSFKSYPSGNGQLFFNPSQKFLKFSY